MIGRENWGLVARRGLGDLWRVTYGDIDGLSEAEYLQRRAARLAAMLPGHPTPDQYRVDDTHLYRMHNRCVASMRVGRVLLCGDAAHVCNPWGGYGCMSAVVDAGGLAECLVGLYEERAGDEILDVYARVRRDKFLRFVDGRSIKNLERISLSDPWTVLETDKFLGLLEGMRGDEEAIRGFLLVSRDQPLPSLSTQCFQPRHYALTHSILCQKTSSIEYDFTQHYYGGAAAGEDERAKTTTRSSNDESEGAA
jgi:hypothetical protein